MTNKVAIRNPVDRLLATAGAAERIDEALNYTQIKGVLAREPFLAAVKDDLLRDKAKGSQNTLWDAFNTDPESALSALTMAAQCKLLPGSAYGLFYLIPRKVKGRLKVMGQVGYKGLCEMSTRHERVHSVEAFLVYEGEEFDIDLASGDVHHKWRPGVERTDERIIAGYSKVIITEAATHHAVTDKPIIWPMDIAQILKRRACSDAYRWAETGDSARGGGKKDSPWHVWMPEQCRKTLLIGGLNHGSVPRDMGIGGILIREAEQDRPAEIAAPMQSRGDEMKKRLGIVQTLPPFDFVEEAVAFIKSANDQALDAAIDRWQHFEGTDAETIARAYEDRMGEQS